MSATLCHILFHKDFTNNDNKFHAMRGNADMVAQDEISRVLVSPAGFEPTTSGLGVLRSIHLSYEDTWIFCQKLQQRCKLRFEDKGVIPQL